MEEAYPDQLAEWADGDQVLVAPKDSKGSHIVAALSANAIISDMIEQGVK